MIQQAAGHPGGLSIWRKPAVNSVSKAQPWEMVQVRGPKGSVPSRACCAVWKPWGSLGTLMSRLVLFHNLNTGPNPWLVGVLPAVPINTPFLTPPWETKGWVWLLSRDISVKGTHDRISQRPGTGQVSWQHSWAWPLDEVPSHWGPYASCTQAGAQLPSPWVAQNCIPQVLEDQFLFLAQR